jgi:hypothetical protein
MHSSNVVDDILANIFVFGRSRDHTRPGDRLSYLILLAYIPNFEEKKIK